MKDTTISLKIDRALKAKLLVFAKNENRSLSNFIERLLKDEVARHEGKSVRKSQSEVVAPVFSIALERFGGAAAATAVMQLTRLWINGVWPTISALAFLLSRIVLWQAAGSGVPDIWTFFVVLAAPAILRAKKSASLGVVALACLFVGMVAGASTPVWVWRRSLA